MGTPEPLVRPYFVLSPVWLERKEQPEEAGGAHLGVQKLGCVEGCHKIRLGQAMGLECRAEGEMWVGLGQG